MEKFKREKEREEIEKFEKTKNKKHCLGVHRLRISKFKTSNGSGYTYKVKLSMYDW